MTDRPERDPQGALVRAARYRQHARVFRATLPRRFHALSLETYPQSVAAQRKVIQHVRNWLDWYEAVSEDQPWLYLHGPFGVGKTGLAGVIGAQLLEDGWCTSASMLAVPRLLDRVRATFNRHSKEDESEADVMEELFDVDLLILDDLGSERATDWATERLFTLINHRHDHELLTIVTSNLAPQQLGEHVGERAMWRIAELSYVVSLEGCPNLRQRKPKPEPWSRSGAA